MKNFLPLVVIMFACTLAFGQLIERKIAPASTDTAINGSADPHFVYLNTASRVLNKLLLFFPGTNASGQDYTLFLKTAADLGYHVIGLDYENDISINLIVCPATRDPSCHGRARNEIWFGTNDHEAVEVNIANSIVYRLNKLLAYLTNNYPNEGWEQYISNDSINWHQIVTAGHSQGAGHATYASKQFAVDRVIMISWIDWIFPGTNPDWVTVPSSTPDSAYYGFIHTGDASIFSGIPTTWRNLGMSAFGPIISIDTSAAPYQYTHSLITSSMIDTTATQTNFHNATSVDWTTPIDPITMQPRFKPVWEYLLIGEKAVPATKAMRISPENVSYIDPEILSPIHKIAFQTAAGNVWLADLDTLTGFFKSSNGLDVLVDQNVTPLLQSFNGPEFGVDQDGWAMFYTKSNGTTPQIWRATVQGNQVNTTPLTTGSIARLSTLATKAPESPSIRLLYSKGPSLDNGFIGYLDENSPDSEVILDSLDDGVRWINGTRSFAYVKQTGLNAGQVAIYDTDTQSEVVITNDADVKTYSYGWFAPEYNDYLVLCIVNDSLLGIYKNNGGAFWERILTMSPPAQALPYRYFGSPEPFVAGGKSYISLVLKVVATTSSYVNAETWVLGIESNEEERLMLRCDDGTVARRTDPESYIGEKEVFIYYNQLNAQGIFEIWRYATGIPVTEITSTIERSDILSIKAFPNPGKDHFQLEIPFKDDYEILLFNTMGKLLQCVKSNKHLNLSGMPSGTYFVIIKKDQQMLRTTIVKQ